MAQKLKVGDKVQLRKDIPTELLGSHGLIIDNAFELQRRGEVTVKDIQEGIPGKEGDDWDSITLEEMGYYWPIELFEPVNRPNKVVKRERKNRSRKISRQ